MKITSVETQRRHPNRRSVFIDQMYAFGIDEEDWFKLNLYVGQELSQEEVGRINQQCNISKAKRQALKYITFKLRTELQVRQKLEQYGFDNIVIEQTINHLKQLTYINDEDYAQKYIKDAIHIKKFGVHRIYRELQVRGIEREIIENQLTSITYDERSTLRWLISKKLKGSDLLDEKKLNRLRNYFIRKGYSLNAINDSIKEILIEQEEGC